MGFARKKFSSAWFVSPDTARLWRRQDEGSLPLDRLHKFLMINKQRFLISCHRDNGCESRFHDIYIIGLKSNLSPQVAYLCHVQSLFGCHSTTAHNYISYWHFTYIQMYVHISRTSRLYYCVAPITVLGTHFYVFYHIDSRLRVDSFARYCAIGSNWSSRVSYSQDDRILVFSSRFFRILRSRQYFPRCSCKSASFCINATSLNE